MTNYHKHSVIICGVQRFVEINHGKLKNNVFRRIYFHSIWCNLTGHRWVWDRYNPEFCIRCGIEK